MERLFFLYYPAARSSGEEFGRGEGIMIAADYFLSPPAKNSFYIAVNRTTVVLYGWIYTCLLVRVRAVRSRVSAAQENLQHIEAQFPMVANATFLLTLCHQTMFSNFLLKQGTI